MPAWFASIIYFVFIILLFVLLSLFYFLFILFFFVRDASVVGVLPSHAARA